MSIFKRKPSQQAIAEIHLTPRRCSNRHTSDFDHFLTNEIISGTAVFKLLPGVDFSHSKITLKGTIRTTTEQTATGAFAKGWRTEKLPFLGVVIESHASKGFKTEDGSISIPFKFDLNECEKLSAFNCGLPPSIDSRQEGQKASDCQYEITYFVTATGMSAKGALASATQKVYVLPVSPDAFSDRHSDVPGEFFWAQLQQASKPKFHRQNSAASTTGEFKIEVAGQEPDAMVINPEGGVTEGSAEIPFVVKIFPTPAKGESYPSECRIKARMVTKTHLTPDGLKHLGSHLEYARPKGEIINKTQYSHEQDVAIPIENWEDSISSAVDAFSVAKFSFLYSIQDERPPLPTFFTPLLARRYMLDLTLSFPNRSDTYKLSLPLDMTYGTAESMDFDFRKKSDASSVMVEARL